MRVAYGVRTPRDSDLSAIVDAVNTAARANDSTAGAQTGDDFRRAWAQMDIAEDAWVVTGPDDEIYGYGHVIAALDEGRIFADAYTHPDRVGEGIGTTLLTSIEARAGAMASGVVSGGEPTDVNLVNHVLLGGDADRMLRARGYHLTRVHKRMRITLDAPLVVPAWPGDVSVRTCTGTSQDLRRVHDCVEGAFGDRWGRAPRSFDQWSDDMVPEGFDPALWLVAERAGRVVGASLCRFREVDDQLAGEVSQLGVRREARQLGLGRALLLASFALFAERGALSVGLDVDSESPTGAHRLYERSGMATTVAIGQFEWKIKG